MTFYAAIQSSSGIFFAGIIVVTRLIYTTVSREIIRFFIPLGPCGPRAYKSHHLTPYPGDIYISDDFILLTQLIVIITFADHWRLCNKIFEESESPLLRSKK